MSTLTNWNQLKKIWFTKKKLILEKVEIIVLNVLDAVLVLTAAKVVITAAAHSVALNDHREKTHTLLTPWSPLPPCLSRRDWHCLDPSFQTEINTWMNPPTSPTFVITSARLGRGSNLIWQDGLPQLKAMTAAHLPLLDEVHKYRHSSLIILSHR